MGGDLDRIKQRLPLLDYLRRQNWTGRPAGPGPEFVGLCPLHPETRPSFYINARKNLFYCHGCGQGGDLIRFIELSQHLSFRQSLAYLEQQNAAADFWNRLARASAADRLEETTIFYQRQLPNHPEALRYLEQRGVHDAALLQDLRIGYAPGGTLGRYLAAQGYSADLVCSLGLINYKGYDAFYQRVVFPCRQDGRVVNLYGRSIGPASPHRFLPGSRGGLFAWDFVRLYSPVLLVEGLFDLAVLWQAGFRNTTCAFGTHLTAAQFRQFAEPPGRRVYLVFDQDENQAGQNASQALALRLQRLGLTVGMVPLPAGQDPNNYFVRGASAADFSLRVQGAQPL
jgi:DNA primase